MTTTTDNAEDQAKAQLENIQAMMTRLEHAQKCDNTECGRRDLDNNPSDSIHSETEALLMIEESPLSILVRSAWVYPGATMEAAEYEILLCTGGPAVRIIGDLDRYNTPDSARLQYQDWGTPWTELFEPRNMATLIAYANTFYFGS